jgi:uncharacterized protein
MSEVEQRVGYEWRRSFLILHGFENRRPAEHWQYWLAGELRARGEQVFYPQLPDPEAPSLEAWLEAAEAELGMMRGERIVVCHSLACLMWVQRAVRRPEAPLVDRLLLVCPPGPGVLGGDPIAAFAPTGAAQLRGAEVARSARLVCTDNDPYCPEPAAEVYGEPLRCEVTVVPGAGHLSLPEGYGPWPEALEWCLDGGLPEGW